MSTDYTKEELLELNRRLRVAVIRAGDLGRYYQNEIRKLEQRLEEEEARRELLEDMALGPQDFDAEVDPDLAPFNATGVT